MKKLLLMSLLLAACTSQDEAFRVLSGAGYTEIEITGYRWIGCGKDDNYHTGFKARGPGGHAVSGVVCSAVFKGATIRLD